MKLMIMMKWSFMFEGPTFQKQVFCLLKHKVFIFGRSTATFITAHQIMYYTLFLHITKIPS